MIRSIWIGILAVVISLMAVHANSAEIQSIQDICYDAPQWLVKLDKHDPLWLTKNLANSSVTDWKLASYTEKMATLALYLIHYEYERDSIKYNENKNRQHGYQCAGIVESMDQEIGKHYLPEDFPVWEFISQLIELRNLTSQISPVNGF